MSELTLTKIRLRNGVWEGRITGAPMTAPGLDLGAPRLAAGLGLALLFLFLSFRNLI